jgi:O-antigen/teichoic acid export membrane protein
MSDRRRPDPGYERATVTRPQPVVAEPPSRPGPSLTRQAGALASGSLAAQASALLLMMALTRLVPKAQLGGYQQLGLIYGILSPLLVAGIPAALLYFLPRSDDPARSRAWVGQAYLLLGSIGLLASLGVVAGRASIAEALGNPELSHALLPYAPYPFLAFVTAVMPTALVAVRRAGLAASLNGLGGAFVFVGVLAATAIEPDAPHMAAGLVVAQLCAALVSIYAVHRAVGISLGRGGVADGVRALLRYGLPLAVTGLAGMLAFQFDRLVVSREFSPALFAVYVVGAVELPLIAIVQQSVNAVLVPALARHYAAGDLAALTALWHRAIRRTSLVLLPVFVFFMVTAGELIRLMFGASYGRSADIFRVYLLLVPLRVATYGLITLAIGRTRINLTASLLLLAMNAGFVLALVGPLGLIGPAVGTVLAELGHDIYFLVRLRGILGLSIGALFPWRMLAANLAVSALAGVPAALLVLAGLSGVLQLAICALLFGPCYLALMVLARRIEPQEIDWGRRAVGRMLALPQRWRRARQTDSAG